MNPIKDTYKVLERKSCGGSCKHMSVESVSTGKRYLFEEINWSLRPKERLILSLLKGIERRIAEMSIIEHSAYIKYRSVAKIDDLYGLLTDCWEGQTLQTYLEEIKDSRKEREAESNRGRADHPCTGKVDPETAVRWISTLLELIDELRRKNKSLKGITDRNSIILTDGEIGVLDNGIALELSTYRGQNRHAVNFIAPETIYGGQWDAASDLFSLGVLFYQMLTGQLPFDDPEPEMISEKIMHKDPTDPRLLNPAIGSGIAGVVMMMLSKDRESRISFFPEIIDRLNAIREKGDYFSDEREQAISKASAKRKRIGEMLYMPIGFFLKNWKLISVLAVIIAAVIFIAQSGRYIERVTAHTSARELVSIHYEALDELDDRLMKETFAKGIGSQRVDMVSRLYVIEKMNKALSMSSNGAAYENTDLLNLSEINIREITGLVEGSPETVVFEAEYVRSLTTGNTSAFRKERIRDTLTLKRVKGEWRIVELREDILSDETPPAEYPTHRDL